MLRAIFPSASGSEIQPLFKDLQGIMHPTIYGFRGHHPVNSGLVHESMTSHSLKMAASKPTSITNWCIHRGSNSDRKIKSLTVYQLTYGCKLDTVFSSLAGSAASSNWATSPCCGEGWIRTHRQCGLIWISSCCPYLNYISNTSSNV